MYVLPSRQRRRNNYSRTLLADRADDMLPHLSRKQLLSIKELLISSGMVNRVVTRSVTLRELLTFPIGDPVTPYIQYLIPVYQPGLRLLRTDILPISGTEYAGMVNYSLNSKPDGSGTAYGQTRINTYEGAMLRWPTSIDPYLFYQVPINKETLLKSQFQYIKSEPVVQSRLGYYPMLGLFIDSVPETTYEHIDDVILILYYLN